MIPTSYVVSGPKLLAEMTSHEVEAALGSDPLLLVPVGSIETHGAHLPLGTDNILGEELSRRLVAALAAAGVPAVGMAPIPFGSAHYFASYPGSISLSDSTLKALIQEVALCLFAQGFRRQVLLTAHAGNDATLVSAGQALANSTPGLDIIYLNWILPSSMNAREICLSADPGAHAGESETSRVMAARPELVHLDRARVEPPAPRTNDAPPVPHGGPGFLGGAVNHFVRDYHPQFPTGSGGDPSVATAEMGDRLYNLAVDWIIAALRRTGFVPA